MVRTPILWTRSQAASTAGLGSWRNIEAGESRGWVWYWDGCQGGVKVFMTGAIWML